MFRLIGWLFKNLGPYIIGVALGVGFSYWLLAHYAADRGSASNPLESAVQRLYDLVPGQTASPPAVAKAESPPSPVPPKAAQAAVPPPAAPAPVAEAPPAVVKAPPAVVKAPPAVVKAPPAVAPAPPAVAPAPVVVAQQQPAPNLTPTLPTVSSPEPVIPQPAPQVAPIAPTAPPPAQPVPPTQGQMMQEPSAVAAQSQGTANCDPFTLNPAQYQACTWRQACLNNVQWKKQMIAQGKSNCPPANTMPGSSCLSYYAAMEYQASTASCVPPAPPPVY